MQRLGLNQSLQQKLSPQQIQFIKLLQVPTAELEQRVEEELELNPVLEEGSAEENESETPENQETEAPENQEAPETPETQETQETQDDGPEEPTSATEDDIDIKDYLRDDDYSSYKTYEGDDDDDKEMPIATS